MHLSATTLLVVLVAVFVAGCRTESSPSDGTTTSTSTDLSSGSVSATDLSSGSVSATDLSSGSVSATDLSSGCITPVGQQYPSKTFILNIIVKMNWYQALAYCNSMGMTLATIDSQQDYDTLVYLIGKARAAGEPGDFWLGGSDLGNEGEFVWVSTGQSMIFNNWDSETRQPDHSNHTGEVEHCVELHATYEYRMNDRHCSHLAYLVCQTP